MGEFIHKALNIAFGNDILASMQEWMNALFDAVISLLGDSNGSGGLMDDAYAVFTGLVVALLTVYFFWHLQSMASRDMFSIDRVVMELIKLFVAIAVVSCLREIIVDIARLGQVIYQGISDAESFKSIKPVADSSLSMTVTIEELKSQGYDNMLTILTHPFVCFFSLIILGVGFVTKMVGYMVCTSNAIMILVYAVFSPIAVVQLFDEGGRSAGVRYIKKFMATCMTMGVICLALIATSALNAKMADTMYDAQIRADGGVTIDNFNRLFDVAGVAKMLIPQFAAIGMMSGCSKISMDIIGM